jgi:hypothetical protein
MEVNKIEQKFLRLHDLQSKYLHEMSLIYDYEISQYKGISHVGHYMASIATRSVSIIKSFEILFNNKLYSTAISLIRLQIDNCLRLYAMCLCNPEYLLDEVTKGNPVRKLNDRDGNKMTDAYLIGKMDEFLPSFKALYGKTSGFIHFSFEHLKSNNQISQNGLDLHVKTLIGDEFEIDDDEKLKYLEDMITASFNLYRLIYSYRYDSQNINEHNT